MYKVHMTTWKVLDWHVWLKRRRKISPLRIHAVVFHSLSSIQSQHAKACKLQVLLLILYSLHGPALMDKTPGVQRIERACMGCPITIAKRLVWGIYMYRRSAWSILGNRSSACVHFRAPAWPACNQTELWTACMLEGGSQLEILHYKHMPRCPWM